MIDNKQHSRPVLPLQALISISYTSQSCQRLFNRIPRQYEQLPSTQMKVKRSSLRIVEIRIPVHLDLNHVQRREFRNRQGRQHVKGRQPGVLDPAHAQLALFAGPEERIERGLMEEVQCHCAVEQSLGFEVGLPAEEEELVTVLGGSPSRCDGDGKTGSGFCCRQRLWSRSGNGARWAG